MAVINGYDESMTDEVQISDEVDMLIASLDMTTDAVIAAPEVKSKKAGYYGGLRYTAQWWEWQRRNGHSYR